MYIRGATQLDVYSDHSSVISPEIFKQLGSYERSEYALSNEVWQLALLQEITEYHPEM